jgi:hypothetical protein
MDDPTNTYPSSAGPTIFSSLVSGSTNAIASITFPIAAWRVTNTSTAGTVSVTRPELVEMFVRAREIMKAYHGIVTKQSSNELMIELPAGMPWPARCNCRQPAMTWSSSALRLDCCRQCACARLAMARTWSRHRCNQFISTTAASS